MLEEKYLEEREQNKEKFSRVPNKLVFRLKLTTLITLLIGFSHWLSTYYFLLFAMPSFQKMIVDLRLAFVHQDYSTCRVSTVKIQILNRLARMTPIW